MTNARETVNEFWRLMATNDFKSVERVLSPDFILEWPQSGEMIRGPERYARMNSDYPAHGPWRFTVHAVVAADHEVVTEVSVTDGVQTGRAISFFTVDAGRIARLREFWPEPYDPPANRAHLVESAATSAVGTGG